MAVPCQAPLVGCQARSTEAESTSSTCSIGGSSSSTAVVGNLSFGEVEERVAAAVGKALDGRSVGRSENFFAAGLHSVSAARVRADLAAQLGPLPVAALYQYPCIAHLAAFIHSVQAGQICEAQERSELPGGQGGVAVGADAMAWARAAGALARARLLLGSGWASSTEEVEQVCRAGLPRTLESGAPRTDRWPQDGIEAVRQLHLLAAALQSRAVSIGTARGGQQDEHPSGVVAQLGWPCCVRAGGGHSLGSSCRERGQEIEDEDAAEDIVEALGAALRLCSNGAAAEGAGVLAVWADLRAQAGGASIGSLRARHVALSLEALVAQSTGWGRAAGRLRVREGFWSEPGLPRTPAALFTSGSFRPSALVTLDLEELGLEKLPLELCTLPVGLRSLNASHNRLRELPPEIEQLGALKVLSLAANSLAFLPDEVSGLPSLTSLSIAGNRIRNAVGEASACQRLVTLDASVQSFDESGVSAETRQRARRPRSGAAPRSSALETLEVSFSGLAEGPPIEVGCGVGLKYYLCIGNNLEKCPDLKRCPSLTSLSLGQNQLRVVPPKFLQGLPDLRWLSLEANRLPKLPPTVGTLRLLRHLMLQGNRLESLPEELGCCTQLRVLEVQHNRLAALPAALARLRSLQFFYAHGNALSDGPALFAALRQVASLKIVGLGGNLLDLSGLGPPERLLPGVRLGVGWNRGAAPCALGTPPLTELHSCNDAWHFDPVVPGRRGRVLAVCFMAQGAPTAQWVGQVQACRANLLSVDALYICDPANAWYLQDPARTWHGIEHFSELLRRHVDPYGSRVLMLGSSMGATACLLFAELAGLALAFSPQVELRSGQGRFLEPTLLDRFERRVASSLRACRGRVVVHVGRRHHADALAARRLAAKAPGKVHVAYHETEQHNTTKYLHERRGQLTAMVRLAVAQLHLVAVLDAETPIPS